MLDRILLSLGDQQLLTGFAILVSGYIRATDAPPYGLLNESSLLSSPPPYVARLVEAHFYLIVFLSCLSSSSHLACVIALRKYFLEHRASFWLRLALIITFAILLTTSICISEVPFKPVGDVLVDWFQIGLFSPNRDIVCQKSHTHSFCVFWRVAIEIVIVFLILYPFWISTMQLSQEAKGKVEKIIRFIWRVSKPWMPPYVLLETPVSKLQAW